MVSIVYFIIEPNRLRSKLRRPSREFRFTATALIRISKGKPPQRVTMAAISALSCCSLSLPSLLPEKLSLVHLPASLLPSLLCHRLPAV